MSVQKAREMKLQREHRPVGAFYKILPSLKLVGNILQEHGFYPGEMVIVTYEQDKVIITTKRPSKEYLEEIAAEQHAERLEREKYADVY
jgi:hypothetical protein